MNRILIYGGYGGFGARLSRRLARQGHVVLVAGRRRSAAEEFCRMLPGAVPLVADRTDPAGTLAEVRPDLVIDAAGPFQGAGYDLPRACIAAGIPYLDLADSRDFVSGIGALDPEARRAGVPVISGASSVPALSGAVIRHLAAGMDEVRQVEMAISASNRATAGPSVAAAILGSVGKPVRLWRGGRWTTGWSWQSLRWRRYAVDGIEPLTRLVALADVPDHDIAPRSTTGAPAVTFRAGPEFTFQVLALWLLSWPVRWAWMRSLLPMAPRLRRMQALTGRLGTDRSAMAVEVAGTSGGDTLRRCWTLVAEHGDGPEIPVLAAELLAPKILAGTLPSGTYDAAGLLRLSAFEPLFASLVIRHTVTETRHEPLYRTVMGERFDQLPPTVRAMHAVVGDGGAAGQATVRRGRHFLSRLAAALVRFPPEGEHTLHVSFAERDGRERWTRDFGGNVFSSTMRAENGHLVERFGPLRFAFDLPSSPSGLAMVLRGWSIWGLPLPLRLAPRITAREWQEDDRFRFDVSITLPVTGLLVAYSGWLRRVTAVPASVGATIPTRSFPAACS